MFGLFNKKPYEPLDYDTRKFYEQNFLWLNQEFDNPKHEKRKIYIPTEIDFPIKWDHSEASAHKAIVIVAESLQIDYGELSIEFFENGLSEINTGISTIFMENDKQKPIASGLYFEKSIDGKYTIALNKNLLSKPDELIATIAHELCHVKLLGEQKLDFNDEHLTDFATVYFGYGVFSANSSFQFYSQYDSWGYQSLGYMKPPEWSYALALSAFYRNEENPEWINYLNPTIKNDFKKSINYILKNKSEIFKL